MDVLDDAEGEAALCSSRGGDGNMTVGEEMDGRAVAGWEGGTEKLPLLEAGPGRERGSIDSAVLVCHVFL